MKKNIINIGISLIVIFILSICFSSSSNAAIEIKPGTAIHTSLTANTEFMYCYNMRSSTSSLANNSLDPHLALNADWGAVVYLGASTYGDLRDGTGNVVPIEDTNYYSLTNNKTGVMDMVYVGSKKTSSGNEVASTCVITAGIFSNASTAYNESNIVYNFKNTKYVDKLTGESTTIGMAAAETNGWYGSGYTSIIRGGITTQNITFRGSNNIFNVTFRDNQNDARPQIYTTYRPVIWN